MLRILAAALLMLMAMAAPARAELAADLEGAVAAYNNDDFLGAMSDLRAAEREMWLNAPMGVRQALFVKSAPRSYGGYEPKGNDYFKGTEPVIFYLEPMGYTQLEENGVYRFAISASFDILDSTGKVLGGKKDLGPFEGRGHGGFSMESMMVMNIKNPGLPAGDYVLRVILSDKLDSAKSVELSKPFKVVP